MTEPDTGTVFAVVVNWNGGEQNLACIASLVATGVAEQRIVFVDNGSVDASLARVRDTFPALCVIENGANLGFGEGANQGAERALEGGAETVFFVNNDVVLLTTTLAGLLAFMQRDERLGVVAPRVLYPGEPARVWCAGGVMTWRQNLSTLLGHGQLDGARWQVQREVDYVAGCAMLVRRSVFARIGMLEAAYFAYMEDVDFCLRAKRAGFGVWSVGSEACLHDASSATGGGYNPRRKYMQGVNSVFFLRQYGGLTQWLRFLAFDVASLPLLWCAGLFRGRHVAVLAKGLGIWHGLLGRRVTAERLESGASRLW
jgi:GT2 family glycosyltransferase